MIRVLLINPPQIYYGKSAGFNTYFPIGLISVATTISRICEVKILDCLIEGFEIKKTGNQTQYGMPFEKAEQVIDNFKPDIVGISAPFSSQKESVKNISYMCRKRNILTVFGGPDASVRYKEILKQGICNFCVVGEGEKTFFELVKAVSQRKSPEGIKGLAYMLGREVRYSARSFVDNLDELAIPNYKLVNVKAYLKSKYLYRGRSSISRNSISIITSRGCPYNCVFCSIKNHMGKKYRSHSPEYVIRHMKTCIDQYGIRNFHFEDDNLALDKKRFEKILDQVEKLNIKWDAPNGIYTGSLDEKLLRKIKMSGCVELTIALESGSQEVLDNIIKKRISLKKAGKLIRSCKRIGIRLKSFYVIGFPEEKKAQVKKTLDLAIELLRKHEVIPIVMFATPLYGTELYEECAEKKLIKKKFGDEDLSNATQIYGEPLITSRNYSKEWFRKTVDEYFSKLRKELIKYSLKHPSYALNRLIRKNTVLKEIGF